MTGQSIVGQSVPQAAAVLQGRLVYLASPYSREVVEDGRFAAWKSEAAADEAARWAARLAVRGVTAVSPIVQAARMIDWGGIDPLDQVFWTKWCAALLRGCSDMVLPPIPGWQASSGCWVEALGMLRANHRVILLAEDPAEVDF